MFEFKKIFFTLSLLWATASFSKETLNPKLEMLDGYLTTVAGKDYFATGLDTNSSHHLVEWLNGKVPKSVCYINESPLCPKITIQFFRRTEKDKMDVFTKAIDSAELKNYKVKTSPK